MVQVRKSLFYRADEDESVPGGGVSCCGRANGRRQQSGAEGSPLSCEAYITALLKYAGTCSWLMKVQAKRLLPFPKSEIYTAN
jgi:hypothetical protein